MKKARDTVKLSNRHVGNLLKNADIGQRICDSGVNRAGFVGVSIS